MKEIKPIRIEEAEDDKKVFFDMGDGSVIKYREVYSGDMLKDNEYTVEVVDKEVFERESKEEKILETVKSIVMGVADIDEETLKRKMLEDPIFHRATNEIECLVRFKAKDRDGDFCTDGGKNDLIDFLKSSNSEFKDSGDRKEDKTLYIMYRNEETGAFRFGKIDIWDIEPNPYDGVSYSTSLSYRHILEILESEHDNTKCALEKYLKLNEAADGPFIFSGDLISVCEHLISQLCNYSQDIRWKEVIRGVNMLERDVYMNNTPKFPDHSEAALALKTLHEAAKKDFNLSPKAEGDSMFYTNNPSILLYQLKEEGA